MFETKIKLTSQNVADQIITAMEGGSGYWCSGFFRESSANEPVEKPWYADPKLYEADFKIRVETNEDGDESFTQASIQKGLDWIAANKPDVLNDIVTENGDADTADIFLQACIFGEIVYG